jgi:uncharacterized membrane protein HdeD (DUF308 family)
MSWVTWLIVLVGIILFCSGAFTFVTHRMVWQSIDSAADSRRPTLAGVLIGVGGAMTFFPIIDFLFSENYRLPLQFLAGAVIAGFIYILRRLEKERAA